MATFAISAVTRKAQATANGSTTEFSFSFSVNTEADVAVFVGTTLKTISTHYTVSITSSTGAGSITFTSGNTPTNGQIVTIMSKTALARSSVYTSGGTINATSLETDFDTNMMLFQQQDERLDRTLIAPVDDATSIDMTLPNKDARKGKVLGFDSSTGNPEATQQVTGAAVNVSTVSAGGSATASVSVSGGTATFALGIPTGATGATGAAGAAGADSTVAGPQGPAGADGDNTVTIKDEGSALSTAASTLNFVGAGVTATGTGAEKTITITDNNTTYSVGDGGLTQNNFTNTLKSKLDGIETSATADQTASEIRTLVESASDSNVFTDADHSKLNAIAASANNYVHPNHSGEITSSADGATVIADNVVDEANLKVSNSPTNGYALTAQSGDTGGLTWAAMPSGGGGSGEANQNAFSNVAVSGQSTVAADSTTDTLNLAAGSNVTITTNAGSDTVTIAATDTNTTYSVGDGGLTTNDFTNADHSKLDGIEASATADQTAAEIRTLVESASDSNVFTDADHSKLNAIEASATADQTDAEIRAAVEAASDSNVFTDADHSKLNAIAASATANPNALDNLSEDTSPQLGGALDVNGQDIVSTSNGAIELDPNGSGKVVFKGNATKGSGQFVLNCENNSHGITIKGPPHSASASYTLTLPNDDGTSGQSLITDGNGVTSWSTISGGSSYTLPIASFSTLGGIKVGSGFALNNSTGMLDLNMPAASTSAIGGVMENNGGPIAVGNTGLMTINSNAINADQLNVSGNGSTSQYLRSDGDGTFTWATPTDTNTVYTHPNHSGEVTSTADGATIIADNVVDEANLKVSNSPTNGYVLTAQSGNTGGLTWAAESTTDSTKLPLAGGTMTGALKTLTSQETKVDASYGSNASTLDFATANVFNSAPSGNVTYTFSNPPSSGTAFGFTLKITPSATATITWPGTVDWAGGSAPAAPASGATNVYSFYTVDGGTTYYGFLAGAALA